MDTRIIVETTIWIEFFRSPESRVANHLKDLLRQRRVLMVGMVLAEIVQGVEPHGQEPVAPVVRRNPPKLQPSFAKASEDTRIPPRSGDRGFLRRRVKDPKEAKLVLNGFTKLPYSEMTRDRWQQTGEISASLRRKGTTLPLSDLIIASCALSEESEVYTLDPHFKKIPGVKLHLP